MTAAEALPLPPPDIPPAARPLIVQSDGTLLLEVTGEHAAAARDALAPFAELVRSPEYVHTYRVTPLSLWNAAAAMVPPEGDKRKVPPEGGKRKSALEWIETVLDRLSRYPVPELVRRELRELLGRYGRVRLLPKSAAFLELHVDDPALYAELARCERLAPLWVEARDERFPRRGTSGTYPRKGTSERSRRRGTSERSPRRGTSGVLLVRAENRGAVKQALIKEGHPAEDLCGFRQGQPLAFRLRAVTRSGRAFALRPYQKEAAAAFHAGGGPRGGAGVVVLPCGAGKTIVGMGIMERLGCATLILTTHTVAVHQWRDELLARSTLGAAEIGEYTGERKEVRPVTVTTYQMLTHRAAGSESFRHLELFGRKDWGLVIYDEVHLLPAPVFRATAGIQARRRLGLTATLVREDGREDDVFALIGPKRYDLPWKLLEEQGFLAEALCIEIRLDLSPALRMEYAVAKQRARFRLAAENPDKLRVVAELIAASPGDQILVIGQYLDQLAELARRLGRPLITGKTPNAERERLYDAFRCGEEQVLVVSKVANFAIDLPDASMAIQVSGTYGSRQEEAQRLGRILRPKARSARFYTLVSHDTREQEFAAKRQLFLVEQGYRYQIVDA